MKHALIYVACSVAALLLLMSLYTAEDIKGRRILLPRFRLMLDGACTRLLSWSSRLTHLLGIGFLRLLLHYSAHSILKRLLHFLRAIEKRVEELLRHNRKVAKDITSTQKTRTHLDVIAEHKEEVALTESQKRKLRAQ